jgi:hypothetical protein
MPDPKSRRTALAALGALVLVGCWSGPDQTEILVRTTPPGASCVLTRAGQPIGSVASTPAIVMVEPSSAEIDIRCIRPGFADTAATLPASGGGLDFGAVFYGPPNADFRRQADLTLLPR